MIFQQPGIDEKVDRLTTKIDAITGVYDDLHEKMHEIDKTRKNNLLFYGIKPDFLPEIPSQLEQKIHEIFRVQLQVAISFASVSMVVATALYLVIWVSFKDPRLVLLY